MIQSLSVSKLPLATKSLPSPLTAVVKVVIILFLAAEFIDELGGLCKNDGGAVLTGISIAPPLESVTVTVDAEVLSLCISKP